MNERYKNPYLWIGLIGIIFNTSGVDINSLTKWSLLSDAIINILENPVTLLAVVASVIGVFVDPTTKGLKDKVK